jgi:hypothetical protein
MSLRLVTRIGGQRYADVWMLPDESIAVVKTAAPHGPVPAVGARWICAAAIDAIAEEPDGYPRALDCWLFDAILDDRTSVKRLAVKLTNAPHGDWRWQEVAAVYDTMGKPVYQFVYDGTGIVVIGQTQREQVTIDLEALHIACFDQYDLSNLDALLPLLPAAVTRFVVAPGAIATAKGHRPVLALDGTVSLAKVNRANL